MDIQEMKVFDICKIYIMLHKREKASFCFRCRGRAWDGFITVTEGTCVFSTAENGQTVMTKGSTVFLRRGDVYTISADEPLSYYTTAFDFSPESDCALCAVPRFSMLDALQLKEIEQMAESWQGQSAWSYMFCKIQLLKLYYGIIASEESGMTCHADRAVSRAIEFVHENYKRNFKSEELAAYCSLSESHLRKKFLTEVGMTVWEYRDALRFKLAREMLQSGLCSVKETAYELGFCDVYYFTKFFLKRAGTTPGKFIGGKERS